jgi:D-sedoheptulose 7-phosphate isomerase
MTPPPDLAPPVASEVPLFGERPRDERRPDGPSPDPARQGRRRRPDADDPEPGPAPALEAEPPVLGGTEHDLLAQLQAELADRERRPRPYRRARSAAPAVNGHGVNGHGVNGHGVNGHSADGDHPDGHGAADPGAG